MSGRERRNQHEITRVIEYLGGARTRGGYAFYSQERRADALKVLTTRFGKKYFVVSDVSSSDS